MRRLLFIFLDILLDTRTSPLPHYYWDTNYLSLEKIDHIAIIDSRGPSDQPIPPSELTRLHILNPRVKIFQDKAA